MFRRFSTRMSQLLSDFPPGPLDYYRKKASFDWKKLKVFLETEEVIEYQNELYKTLENHPEYHKELLSHSLDEERRQAVRQMMAHKNIELLSIGHTFTNLKFAAASLRTMMQFAPSSAVKFSVGDRMFISVIRSLGSERHEQFIEDADDCKIFGCFCLTEIGHGSNTKKMRTTATYNKDKQQFVLNTPDFEAAKCWAGSLGQTATHAIVYAQLIIDNVQHGLHAFIVQIRDPKTLIPCPGIIVGDMGEKIGLNGIDNGFLIFDNYHIPRENLLNKTGDVTLDGRYVTPYKNPNARYGASFGALSAGRVNITGICEAYGTKAITIAIRYAAVRKQFGPDNQPEIPILEYQSHQHRLIPYLAASFMFRIFTNYIIELQYQFSIDSLIGEKKETLPDRGIELHGISSASKPVAGWLFRDGIQECREACGGHGYLKVSGIGDVRNDHDANCTYEGENHVLIQQTSNWLLKYWPEIIENKTITSPYESVNFLSNYFDILREKFVARNKEDLQLPETIIKAFQWLVCYYLRETKNKLDTKLKNGEDQFWAKNNTQVYFAKNLGIVYLHHYVLHRALIFINQSPDIAIKNVLLKLFSLYGLWNLEKFLSTLYQGGYINGAEPTTLIHETILALCYELKDDVVSLIDVLAPPDFILNSVLGSSDGEVYKRLQSAMLRTPNSMSRPTWWQDLIHWQTNLKHKL